MENQITNQMANIELADKWRYNIRIGTKIKLLNNNINYMFYGYNHNKTIISCFPVNSKSILDNLIYIDIQQIEVIIGQENIIINK